MTDKLKNMTDADFHLEEWPTDHNQVRIVSPDGRVGPWFSRLLHTDDDGILNVPDEAFHVRRVLQFRKRSQS